MPPCSGPSPTAVIQDWLSHTEVGHKAETHASSSSKKERTSRIRHRQHRRRNVKDDLLPHGPVCPRIESRDCDRVLREAENLHLPASFERGTRNLARRLGLRTPFRTLDNNQNQVHAKENFAIPIEKRKRSLSSSSSYLRPRARRRSFVEADGREHLICPKPAGHADESDRGIAKSSFHLPRSSAAEPNSFKTVAKPYERKSRHKTREDHYILKEAPKVSKHKTDEGENLARKKGKRKRRGKSGSALMHDFTASNVAFNRLTLRSAPAVGIFSKGRASSPIKRMGLPDLAFSEAAFLKSRRDKPESLHEPLERSSRRGKRGFADDDAEISRYFTSTKASLPHRLGPELESLVSFEQRCLGSKREGVQVPPERQSIKGKSLLPLLELPETPFLGFGSSGFSMSSPMKLHKPLKTSHRATHSPDHHTSPTRSTAYYTWSRSGALSQGSLPVNPASQAPPRPGLNNECGPNRKLAGHAVRHQDVQMENPLGDDASRQSEVIASEAEDQAPLLDAGCRPGRNLQPIDIRARSKELPNENGKDDNGKSPRDVKIQDFSANSSTKTSLAERTLVAGLDIPFVSSHCRLDKTASLKSFDAALDRLIRQCTETPSWRNKNSHHETAVPSGAGKKEPSCIDSGSLNKAQAAGHDALGSKTQDSYVITANPTSGIAPSFPPSAPIIQAPQILYNQARMSLGPSSSMAMLGGSPRPYEYGAHKVPGSRKCVMGRSEMPAKNAWHGYDNMYERQETHRYNFSSGGVGNVRGYTPGETLCSEEFIAPEEHFTHPYHGLDTYRHREKVGFQQLEERSSNPLNKYSENLRGATYQNINSPASHELFAKVGDQGGRQFYEEYSQDKRFEVGGDARLEVGQKCLPQCSFDTSGQPRDLARHDYPLFEPYGEDNPLPWSQATPSHTARSRYGFTESPDRLRPGQDEEGHFTGFWKPHLLY